MSFFTALQPAQRSLQRIACRGLVGASRNDMIECHRDICAERPLNLDGALRSQSAPAAIDMTLKLDAIFIDFAEALEGKDLKAARVGQQRPLPRHELVQAAELRDDVLARADVEVVRVREYDLRADG